MDIDKERAQIIEKHGGLSDVTCAWKECDQLALADLAVCFDHAEPDFHYFKSPENLHTAEDAILMLGCAAKLWVGPFRTIGFEDGKKIVEGEKPQYKQRQIDEWDLHLEHFVRKNPGALEAILRDTSWLKRLAYTRTKNAADAYREGRLSGGLPESVLLNFLNEASPVDGEFLWRTIRACDPVSMLRFAIQSCSWFQSFLYFHPPEHFLFSIARWLGVDRFAEIAPELSDVARTELLDALSVSALDEDFWERTFDSVVNVVFPPILPDTEEEIIELGADEISLRLAQYRGITVEGLQTMLVQERFLGEAEQVGEVIVRDARTLRELGVTRHEVARVLREACRAGWSQTPVSVDVDGTPYQVNLEPTLGHHQDPFHSVDTYYISREVRGSADCVISSDAGSFSLSDMHPYLIRRACFFEGDVRYRLDPALVCRVLGLV